MLHQTITMEALTLYFKQFFSITIDECAKDPCICEQTCLFFSGAVLGCHVYLITDGSIVTSSINLYQYILFVIITRRKPCLSIYEVKLLRFSVNINRTVLNIKLCKTEMVSLCLRFLGKMECKRTLFILQLK